MSDFLEDKIKVYFTNEITTVINKNGEEKKNLSGILPSNWTKATRSNKDYKYGYMLRTGKINDLTIIDFDNEESFNIFDEKYHLKGKHLSVKTRKGYHIYFNYVEGLGTVKGQNKTNKNIDTLNDNKGCIGVNTKYKDKSGKTWTYGYLGGSLRNMPEEMIKEFTKKDDDDISDDYKDNCDNFLQLM